MTNINLRKRALQKAEESGIATLMFIACCDLFLNLSKFSID